MPIDNQKKKAQKKRYFIVYNKQCLCDHGGFHPMIERKGKFILDNVYNQTKEIFTKIWKAQSMLGLDSSEEIPNFNNNEISERNIKYGIFTTQLWNNIKKMSY